VSERIERIKACLNGRRGRGDHPALPVTPAQLAGSGRAAVAAGAEALHVHARGGDGAESLRAADVGAAVAAIRSACPGTPVGVSTGVWITGGDPEARHAAVTQWAALPGGSRPDFASVNLAEPGLDDLLMLLETAGIAPEAGVWTLTDVPILARVSRAVPWLRIMVELGGLPGADAVATAGEILTALGGLGLDLPVLLHGEQASCWPLIAQAGRLGLATRIGLEDTLAGPDGEPVSGNAELVGLALARWTAAAG
jgi:uncharacterized protein (DUF849 family)